MGKTRAKLEVYQSLWAMELSRPDGVERSLEEAIEMVAAAGFRGVAIDLGASDMATAYQLRPRLEANGLGSMMKAFPRRLDVS